MNKAFVINLDSRLENFQKVQEEFLPFGIHCERFSAIVHSKGAVGCALSHLALIAQAKKEGWPWVMVLEDDCSAREAMKEWPVLSKFLTQTNSRWDLFLGGGTHVHPIKLQNDFQKIGSTIDLIECAHIFSLHFAVYNSSAYDRILAWHDLPLPLEERPAIDVFIQQCNLRIWVSSPFLAWQKAHVSTLLEKQADYSADFKRGEHKLDYFAREIRKSLKYRLLGRWLKKIS